MKKYEEEISRHHTYVKLCDEILEVSDLRYAAQRSDS